jgi:hypothetical protein
MRLRVGFRKTTYKDSQKVKAFGWMVVLLRIALCIILKEVTHRNWTGEFLILIGTSRIIGVQFVREIERKEELQDARLQGPLAVETVLARHRAELKKSLPRNSGAGNPSHLFARGRVTQQVNSNLRSVGRLMSGDFGEGRRRTRRKMW